MRDFHSLSADRIEGREEKNCVRVTQRQSKFRYLRCLWIPRVLKLASRCVPAVGRLTTFCAPSLLEERREFIA